MTKYTLPMDMPPPSSRSKLEKKRYPFLFLSDDKLQVIDQIEGVFLFNHVDDSGLPFTVEHNGIATHQYVKGSLTWLRVFCTCAWCKLSPEGCNSFDVMATLFVPGEEQSIPSTEQLPLNPRPSGRYSIILLTERNPIARLKRKERHDTIEEKPRKEVIDESTLESMLKGKRR
jgi:hypothetical protein